MEGLVVVGWAFIVSAILGVIGLVALFRADARRGGRGAGALAVMVTLGALAPISLLVGWMLVMMANSDSFGR